MDLQLIASADFGNQAVLALQRHEISAVDAIAEKDAGVKLGDDALDSRLGQGQRRVLAAGAAAEVLAADDDLVVALELVLADEFDVPLGQPGLGAGDAAVGIHAKEFALFR